MFGQYAGGRQTIIPLAAGARDRTTSLTLHAPNATSQQAIHVTPRLQNRNHSLTGSIMLSCTYNTDRRTSLTWPAWPIPPTQQASKPFACPLDCKTGITVSQGASCLAAPTKQTGEPVSHGPHTHTHTHLAGLQ